MTTIDNRSVSELFADALSQFSKLISNEVQLAKAEMSAKINKAVMGAAFIAVAGLMAIPVLVMLLFALASALSELGWSDPLAYLASAVVGAVVSGILAWIGMNRLKANNMTPTRTMEQLRRDAQAVKEATS